MILTPDNYLSPEADREFMSFHQYRNWMDCSAAEYARIFDGWDGDKETEALLLGQYIDKKLLTPEVLPEWLDAHPEVYLSRGKDKGGLKEQYRKADVMVASLLSDPVAVKMIEGEHQWLVTGVIGGVNWRGMVDDIQPTREVFVDLKSCRNVEEDMWNAKVYQREMWYEFYNIWTQLAVYQELIFQKYGKKFLPMILAVDKQEPPDKAALAFQDQYRLDVEIAEIQRNMPRVLEWKAGKKIKPCGKCAYCRTKKQLKITVAKNQGIRASDDILAEAGF